MRNHYALVSSVFAAVLLLPTVAAAEPACDASSLSGGYGFHLTGTNLTREQSRLYAVVGRFEADGQGGFAGTATHSAAGMVARMKFTGTYTINPDCTGTSTMTFANGSTASLDFVLTSDLDELFIIDASHGIVESGSGRRQFKPAPPSPPKTSKDRRRP
jgi:hypothetical protein